MAGKIAVASSTILARRRLVSLLHHQPPHTQGAPLLRDVHPVHTSDQGRCLPRTVGSTGEIDIPRRVACEAPVEERSPYSGGMKVLRATMPRGPQFCFRAETYNGGTIRSHEGVDSNSAIGTYQNGVCAQPGVTVYGGFWLKGASNVRVTEGVVDLGEERTYNTCFENSASSE